MRTPRSTRWRLVCLVLIISFVATGCWVNPPDPARKPVAVTTTVPSHPAPPPSSAEDFPRLGGTAPGSLISVTEFDSIDPRITVSGGATAWRVSYLSTSAVDSAPVEVTGVVFVPGGRPPDHGWEVIAYNHSNTGIGTGCGPSLYDDMLNQWLPLSVLLLHGYVVVESDYEGLGGSGSHAFANADALGRNVIDIVRAAGNMRPDIGNRWAAFGGSLGGLATWAANEQASTYGQGLDLVGAAAWAPMVDVSSLPAKAAAGTMTREQWSVYASALVALQRTTHPELDLTRFLHGSIYDRGSELEKCVGLDSYRDLFKSADASDFVPADAAAEQEMTALLNEIALPRQRTAAPMLILYGSLDRLTDEGGVERAITQACKMGDVIQSVLRPGEDQDDLDASMAFYWVRARFDDQTPLNTCPRPVTR